MTWHITRNHVHIHNLKRLPPIGNRLQSLLVSIFNIKVFIQSIIIQETFLTWILIYMEHLIMKNMIMSNKFARGRNNTIRSSTHYKITNETKIGRRNIGNKLVCKKRNTSNNLAHGKNTSKIINMNCVLIKQIKLLSTIVHPWAETSTTPPCLPWTTKSTTLTTSPSFVTTRKNKITKRKW